MLESSKGVNGATNAKNCIRHFFFVMDLWVSLHISQFLLILNFTCARDIRPSIDNRNGLEDQDDAQGETEDDETNEMTLSTGESLLGLPSAQPSPFSKQRRIHKGHNPRDESSK